MPAFSLPPIDPRLIAAVPVISVRHSSTAQEVRTGDAAHTAWAMSAWSAGAQGPAKASAANGTGAGATAAGDFGWLVDRAVHDLRNSLSAIRIGVELMNRSDAAGVSAAGPVLDHIDSAAQRAHALSEELSDACRLASGRPLVLHPQRFGLHGTVQQALHAVTGGAPASLIEHDRLGEGDCTGDPLRIGQFIALALEEIRASAPSALVIVISEVAGERFRIAVHADAAQRAATQPAPPRPARQALAESRRRTLLMQAIAQAHGGILRIASADGSADRSIDASFTSLPLPGAAV